ncbi:MAG: hypothetical protein ACMZ7B_10420 [Balneola sp.]
MSEFKDNGVRLWELGDYRLIKCPKCSKPVDYYGYRLSCAQCGFIDDKDHYPDYELFLKIDCCSEVLWAMNLEHLDFLEDYVSAKIRTRTPNINKSLASRLPQWIKSKKNRGQILKCLNKLRDKLKVEGYQKRVVE